jgi:predicted CoA-binding protein
MIDSTRQVISEFLARKRIAVVGASRNPRETGAALFRELRGRGYDVVPVNPSAVEIEGVPCRARLQDIDPQVEAALVITNPEATGKVVEDCREAGIRHVWLYGTSGKPANPGAVEFCRANGIAVVPGFCPFMFLPGTPWVHRLHGALLKIVGAYPA